MAKHNNKFPQSRGLQVFSVGRNDIDLLFLLEEK